MPCFIQECFQLCIVRIYCLLSNCSYEVLELLVLCNEVCLRVYFYDSSGAFVFYSNAAETFCSDTTSLLLSLCLSVLSFCSPSYQRRSFHVTLLPLQL